MPFDILNILQTLLLPLVGVAVALIGLLVWLGGRKSTPKPPARPVAARPPAQVPAPPAAPPATPPAAPATAPTARRTAAPVPPAAPAAPTAPVRATAPVVPNVPVSPAPVAPATATLPAAQPASPPPAPPAPPAPPRPRMADLLLVDDSAVVRARLRRLFEPAGYSIALAQDGEEALALLAQGQYGLMVTDLEMPKLDGVGLIRAAMDDPGCAHMPMLAITGHEDLQAKLNELHAVAGIYRKPWIDDELLGHVRHLVAPSLIEADES